MSSSSDVDEAVRRYATTLVRRYLPAIAFFAAVALLLTLAPTQAGSGADEQLVGLPSEPAVDSARGQLDGDELGAVAEQAVPGVQGGDAGSSSSTEEAAEQAGQPSSGEVAAPAPGRPVPAKGVARSGVTCDGTARQVPWSKYAPPCVPKFTGSNGGATAQGVKDKTITLTFRRSDSPATRALSSSAKATLAPDEDYLADLNTYISLFNKNFELYGRQVRLVPFSGQGDYIQEAYGQNLQGAQADAATARELGGFADVSHFVYQSVPYAQALAQNKLISMSTASLTQKTYRQYDPFMYTYMPTADRLGQFYGNLVCAKLAKQRAVFAGDTAMRKHGRVFGLAVPDVPNYKEVGDVAVAVADRGCGQGFERRVNYDPNDQSQAASLIAQMKSAGVTTLVTYANAAYLASMTQQANAQDYRPEWVIVNAGDPANRLPDSGQMQASISGSDFYFISGVEKAKSEAYRAYKRAKPNGEPQSYWYAMAYYSLLQLFSALQAAGPDLSPHAFRDGMFSLPTSLPGGDAGTWSFGKGAYSPIVGTRLMAWDSSARSEFDGQLGTSKACEGGRLFPLSDLSGWGTPGRQPSCPGRG
jgi:hypothetical protein